MQDEREKKKILSRTPRVNTNMCCASGAGLFDWNRQGERAREAKSDFARFKSHVTYFLFEKEHLFVTRTRLLRTLITEEERTMSSPPIEQKEVESLLQKVRRLETRHSASRTRSASHSPIPTIVHIVSTSIAERIHSHVSYQCACCHFQ